MSLSYLAAGQQFVNKPNIANGIELVMSGTVFIPGFGWAIAGTYFLANTIGMAITGKSIGQQVQGWIEER